MRLLEEDRPFNIADNTKPSFFSILKGYADRALTTKRSLRIISRLFLLFLRIIQFHLSGTLRENAQTEGDRERDSENA
jgi:hypothetical protein